MSSHEIGQEGDSKKFTVTAFTAFVVVFAFLMLMQRCHGKFVPNAPAATEEHAPAAHGEK